MHKLHELYFGELEAFDEALNQGKYFEQTYVAPQSMSLSSLRNNRKFIIVGRKGVGKTAIQMHLANSLEKDGYKSCFFRFSEDMRADDYSTISKTQSHITWADTTNEKSLFVNYDFRDVWERIFLNKCGETIAKANQENKFSQFVFPKGSALRNIFSGITKSLSIKINGELAGIAGEIGFDGSQNGSVNEIALKDFNGISRQLLKNHCKGQKIYFFVDELVFSKLDAKADEITIRSAMVRDILKTVRELNNFCAQSGLDIHFICTLRPEIRNLINSYDSEIGKIVDGKDVNLNWFMDGNDSISLIEEVFKRKIEYANSSFGVNPIKFREFVSESFKFGSKSIRIGEFIKTNTWGRPRDLVRLLLAISKMSPNSTTIGEAEIKSGLDEYSRASAKELVDELSVMHGRAILVALQKGITRKTYDSKDDFLRAISLPQVNEDRFFTEAFELGLIGGYQPENGNYHWAHRGETTFRPHYKVRIHPALWNELSIRGQD
jgi:hypothetical protein